MGSFSVAARVGWAALVFVSAIGSSSAEERKSSYEDYVRVWMQENSVAVPLEKGCRVGVNPKNGRRWDEIDRCGPDYGIATDEQVVLAQLERAKTFKRMADQRCSTGSPYCKMFEKQAEAVSHTTIVQVAAYTAGQGDGTVELADDGTVKMKLSNATFVTPETERLARMTNQERLQVAGFAGSLDTALRRLVKHLKMRLLGEDDAI